MSTLKFKTNINCGNCIAKFTPFVAQASGIDKWEVDTNNPEKVLTIEGSISEDQAIELVEKAGFKVLEIL